MSTESRLENIAKYESRSSMNVSAEVYRGHVISIWYDECPESPREWDNVAVLCLDHRRYTLPWECDEVSKGDFDSGEELVKLLKSECSAAVIMPVWGYDHGNLAISTGSRTYPFNDVWDSGMLGFAYVTRETILKELGLKRVSKRGLEWAERMIMGEIETYGAYLNGQIYGFSILNDDGDVVDSCAGFYDVEYLMTEARAQVDGLVSSNEN